MILCFIIGTPECFKTTILHKIKKSLKPLFQSKMYKRQTHDCCTFWCERQKDPFNCFFWQFLSWNFDTFVTSHSSRLFPFTFHRNENSNFSFDLIWRREKNEIWKLINNVPKISFWGHKKLKSKKSHPTRCLKFKILLGFHLTRPKIPFYCLLSILRQYFSHGLV